MEAAKSRNAKHSARVEEDIRGEQPNIILIVADTLRRDAIGAYSNNARTPNIDEFGHDSVIYPNAVAPYTWTIPSHISMFTGNYLEQLGLREETLTSLSEVRLAMERQPVLFLSERLSYLGYDTIGISANELVGPLTGLDRGFRMFIRQHYFEYWDPRLDDEVQELHKYGGSSADALKGLVFGLQLRKLLSLYLGPYKERKRLMRLSEFPRRKGARRILETLRNSTFEQPFFLFLNFMEVHEPYEATVKKDNLELELFHLLKHSTIRRGTLERIRKNYREETELLDKYVGMVFSLLKQKDLYEDSLIVLTSDHGQALGERGFVGHGTFLYDEIIRVPLLIKYPGNARPTVGQGYQNLVDMCEFLVAGVTSRWATGFPTSESTFARSCGLNPFWREAFTNAQRTSGGHHWWPNTDTLFEEKSVFFSQSSRLLLNAKTGTVEEYLSLNEHGNQAIRAQIVEAQDASRRISDRLGAAAQEPISVRKRRRTDNPDDNLIVGERLKRLGYI